MLFNSLHFLLFFPIITLLYFLLKKGNVRWLWLLLASCYFYMAFIPSYILFLFLVIIIDYTSGIIIEKSEGGKRKRWLVISLVANIGLLGIFKYYNFFNENIAGVAHYFHIPYHFPALGLLLPIGLSFHTFQSMSYTIEVYRKNFPAERNVLLYSLYVLFFPQLVAGPIERPKNVLPQFYKHYDFDYQRVTDGLKLMAWGLFKKVVIADRLSLYVNQVYNHAGLYHGLPVILTTWFFSFQIFCDFSGYSDIAIGTAQILGIKLMTNFNRPYFSKSISEFWSRWHISLSTWFKDYLYIPLGGNRVAIPRLYFNIFIVFLISGFWHGANWTFILWGALHGFYIIFAIIFKPAIESFTKFIGLRKQSWVLKCLNIFITFQLVSFSWIFFRAQSIQQAFYIIRSMFKDIGHSSVFIDVYDVRFVLSAILLIAGMEIIHYTQRSRQMRPLISNYPLAVRWSLYNGVVILILFFGIYARHEFIYFRF
jgi:alginate O-acetyltransferase complex protein AlgI